MVQWFRLHVSTAGNMGSIPSQGTRIPHVALLGQNKMKNQHRLLIKKKKKRKSCDDVQKGKDVNDDVLKGVSIAAAVQSREEADDKALRRRPCLLCCCSCAPHQPGNRCAFAQGPLSDPCCALSFCIHSQSFWPRNPPNEESQFPPEWAFLSNDACLFLS